MKKILIVEDFISFNNTVKEFLVKHDFYVVQAFTIEEAKKAMEKDTFDFILLDLILPDGEGEEIVKLKKSGLSAKIIIFTGDDDSKRRENLFFNGILDFISKQNPYEYLLNELLKTIHSIENNHNINILVIDDSRFIRHVVKEILLTHNYQISEAYNGKGALEQIDKRVFDLIILDLNLPDINGEKILNRIRKNSDYLNTPIVVLSGTQDKELVSRVLKHGADEFIHKPFSIEELVLKVKIFLKLSANQKDLEEFNKTLEKKVEEEIKKRKEQEQIAIHKARQASMGEMIGNIAHQWRQPLNALSIIFDNLEDAQEHNELDKDFLKIQSKEAYHLLKNMSTTIDDFKNYFKPSKKRKEFQINSLIEDTLVLYKGTFKKHKIEVTFQPSQEKLKVVGFPNELSQGLMVLLSNAKDAINEQKDTLGKIEITTLQKDDRVIIRLKDNGGGMPESIATKVFDPYFTTKEEDGTGVGLYMTKKIIEEKFNGTISLSNNKNGATFTIDLPQASL